MSLHDGELVVFKNIIIFEFWNGIWRKNTEVFNEWMLLLQAKDEVFEFWNGNEGAVATLSAGRVKILVKDCQ